MIFLERGLAVLIGEYAALWKFPLWVTSRNFAAKKTTPWIAKNPMAMDVMGDFGEIDWHALCENHSDWAVDLVCANLDEITDWYFLARNENDRAIAIVDSILIEHGFTPRNDELFEIDEMLSANRKRINFLKQNPQFLNPVYLMWNPAAKELIDEMKIQICYEALATNSADWAIDMLFQANVQPSCSNPHPRAVAYFLAHPELIDWSSFSYNPTAIDYLRAHPDKVKASIFANPAVLEPTIPNGLVDLLMEL